jgi:hypothetical protein
MTSQATEFEQKLPGSACMASRAWRDESGPSIVANTNIDQQPTSVKQDGSGGVMRDAVLRSGRQQEQRC